MGETLLDWLAGIPGEVQMMVLSGFPLTELRGSIPLAWMNADWAWPLDWTWGGLCFKMDLE